MYTCRSLNPLGKKYGRQFCLTIKYKGEPILTILAFYFVPINLMIPIHIQSNNKDKGCETYLLNFTNLNQQS